MKTEIIQVEERGFEKVSRPPRAGRMEKFRPLPEPIRLQDLLNSARSGTEKNIIQVDPFYRAFLLDL